MIQRPYERVAAPEDFRAGSLIVGHVLARLGFAPVDARLSSAGPDDTGEQRRVRLDGVYLQRADLQGAHLQRANLQEAQGLSAGKLADAKGVGRAIMTPGQRRALGLAPQPQDREAGDEPDESDAAVPD